MTTTSMTCERFDELLADYLEGVLDAETRIAMDAHRVGCLRCAALVRDLEHIRQDAAALPELVPSRDLWAGISERIDREVVSAPAFGGHRATTPATPAPSVSIRQHRLVRWGIAAAALITVSSGVTYYATVSRLQGRGPDSSAVAVVPRAGQTSATPESASVAPELNVHPAGTTALPVSVASTARVRVPAGVTYDHEITDLRKILDQRRSDLDASTVAVIEHSLTTIDKAIAEARSALASDPGSKFLSEQLDKALEKKLGLLRTVALLPSRA